MTRTRPSHRCSTIRRRASALAPLGLLVSLGAGCFSEAKDEYFYHLERPGQTQEQAKGPRLVVATLVPASGYDTPRIAIRTSKHEIQYYAYRQWVSEPARMLTEMTVQHLRRSGRFAEVASQDKVREPDAILEGTVDAIEQVDRDKTWDARLAMTFVLRRGDSEQVLLRHSFDLTRPCARRHPDDVAAAVSGILGEEAKKLAVRITNALR